MLRQLLHNTIRISIFLIHFVDGNNNRNTRSFRMAYGFYSLRFNAIIGGNHQNYNVR